MIKNLGHGPRLTDEEYDKKIIGLHSSLPAAATREQDRVVRRKELEFAVDHRLGINFPADRREALWTIQERVERKRLRLAFTYFLRKIFTRWFVRDVRKLTGFLVDEYAKVLTKDELESFFDLQEGERPSLPIDREQLKK